MRRGVVAIAAAAALLGLWAGPIRASMHGNHGPAVSIGFASYLPPAIDVIRGETITWTNDSVRMHTVTSNDGSWDSGVITTSGTFSRQFDGAGDFPYYCRLHAGIVGKVDVYDILLDAPRGTAAPGHPFALSGRSALPVGAEVTIEGDSGAGFAPATTAHVAADGSFAATVTPQGTTSYRAVAADKSSPAVQLLVLDHQVFRTSSHRGRRTLVTTRVTPATPGSTVVLQLRIRQRFGWWPVLRAKVNGNSIARFRLSLSHRYAARVVLTLPDGATVLATSLPLDIGPTH